MRYELCVTLVVVALMLNPIPAQAFSGPSAGRLPSLPPAPVAPQPDSLAEKLRQGTATHPDTGLPPEVENRGRPSVSPLPLTSADGMAMTNVKPSTVTDGEGYYKFRGVPRASHQVWIETGTLPLSLQPRDETQPVKLLVNPGQTMVSDVIGANVRFTASYDDRKATISGVVFVDQDGNGRQGPGEPGVPGVTVIDPGLHQYFIPFNYANLRTLFQGTLTCEGTVGSTLAQTVISLVASGDNTVFYYDHWEDGYDADPTLPGATTIVGVLNAGQSRVFQNPVNTAALPATPPVFDGRDRITVLGEDATVTMAFWLNNPGTLLAGAWEIPDVANWGTDYVLPVGEDLGKDTGGAQGAVDWGVFDYVGLEVMAATPGTTVTVNTGAGLQTAVLNPGETLFVPGNAGNNNNPDALQGIYSGATVNATAPVQVQVRAGQCNDSYGGRSYTLEPTAHWTNDYWAPSPDWGGTICTTGDGADHFADVYIRNANPNAITINWQNSTGNGLFNVPANTTASFRNDPTVGFATLANGGLHLWSTSNFWAVAVADSADAAANGGINFDWSYSLIPASELASQVILGWSPGAATPTGSSGSLAYVTAVDNTQIFVDLNQDGSPDKFDINGDGDTNDTDVFGNLAFNETSSDQGISLNAGQVLRVADPNPADTGNAPAYFGNSDLNGARIYTRQLAQHIAVAWGEDPCRAAFGSPYLDLGYTVLPVPIPNLIKTATLAVDADMSGGVSPGDIISYTLVLHNNGQGDVISPVLTDVLPYTYTDFIVGSLAASTSPASTAYDNGSGSYGYTPVGAPGSTDPAVQAFRLNWPTLAADGFITVTLRLRVQTDLPPDVTEVINQARLTGDNIPPILSQDPTNLTPGETRTVTPVNQPVLRIHKEVNTSIALPGDVLTYTIVLENVGDGVAVDTRLSDELPPFQTYVPNSLVLTSPQVVVVTTTTQATTTTVFTGSYADDFDAGDSSSGYAGNDGSLAWGNDWQELNDDGSPFTGDVQVVTDAPPYPNAHTSPAYLQLIDTDGADDSAWRQADLADFLAPALYFYRASNATAGDAAEALFVDVSTNGGGAWVQVVPAIAPPNPASVAYAFQQVDLTPYAGPAFALRLRGPAALDAGEFIWVDNVSIVDTDPVRTGTTTLVHTTSSLTYSTASGLNPVSQIGSTLVLTQGVRLPAGGAITATFQVTLSQPLTNGLVLTDTAEVTASNLIATPFPLTDTASVTILSGGFVLSKQRISPSPVAAGDPVTFTIAITNNGNTTLLTLPLTDTYDITALSYQGAVPPPVDPADDGQLNWTDLAPVGGLAPGETVVVTTSFVALARPGGYVAVNIAQASASDVNGPLPSQQGSATVTFAGPVLGLDKSVDPPGVALPGGVLTYTLCYSNSGTALATGVVITDFIPANTTYITGSVTSPNGETVEWYNGSGWAGAEPISGTVGLRWLVGSLPADSLVRCVSFQVRINLSVIVTGAGGSPMTVQYTPQGWSLGELPTPPVVPTVTLPVTETPTPTVVATTTPTITETPTPTGTAELTATPTLLPSPTLPITPSATPPVETATATPTLELTPTVAPPIETATPEPAPLTPTETLSATMAPTEIITPPVEITPTVEITAAISQRAPGWAAPAWWQITATLVATPVETPIAETATPTSGQPAPTESVQPLPETVTETGTPTATPTAELVATPAVTVSLTPEPSPTVVPAVIVPFETYTVTLVNTGTLGSNETPTITDTVTTPLITSVDPRLTKRSDPTQAQIGDVVTTTITVINQGNANATDVIVRDQLPIYLDLVSVTSTLGTVDANLAGRVFTVTVPVLGPGQQFVVTATTVVNNNAAPPPVPIVNTANLTFNEGAPRTSSTTVVVPAPPSEGPHEEHEAEPTPTPPLATPTPTATPAVLFLPETGSGDPRPTVPLWPLLLLIPGLLTVRAVRRRRR